jgi:hypothetical protein
MKRRYTAVALTILCAGIAYILILVNVSVHPELFSDRNEFYKEVRTRSYIIAGGASTFYVLGLVALFLRSRRK